MTHAGVPSADVVLADVLRELKAAQLEKRPMAAWVPKQIPLGTYEQIVEAAFLGREICVEVYPMNGTTHALICRLCRVIDKQCMQAIERKDWLEVERWMRASPPLYFPCREQESRFTSQMSLLKARKFFTPVPGRMYTHAAMIYPTELQDIIPGAYADVLRGVFACSALFIRTRDWQKVHERIKELAFGLNDVDLSDTGGPHDANRTPFLEWELRVQPYLDKWPTPNSINYEFLQEFGRRLRDDSPLSPVLFRTALFAMHPRCSGLFGILPLSVRELILRQARKPRSKL